MICRWSIGWSRERDQHLQKPRVKGRYVCLGNWLCFARLERDGQGEDGEMSQEKWARTRQ